MRALLRVFYYLLYHPFAFTYDLVAAIVSFGNWKNWVMEVVPFIKGTRILEIGHGPGHLQRFLLTLRHGSGQTRDLVVVAIDESAPMGRLAKRNLSKREVGSLNNTSHYTMHRSDYAQINLTRGLGQQLPFRNEAFDTIIATFPAEYISDPRTLSEVKRCLSDGGRFVVLPVALPKNRFLSWLFRVTGQAPSDAMQVIREKLEEPFVQSEFDVETHVLEKSSGTLIIIVATAQAAVPGDGSLE